MDLKYSEQARVMMKNLKEFDLQEFEKWFFDNLSVGSNNILEFLIRKENELKKRIVIPQEVNKNGSHFK